MAVIDGPSGVPGTSPADLLSQTAVLARRLLLRSARTPMTLVHAVVLPVAFLLTLHYVFGTSISDATGQNALYGMVALVALLATMTGSATGMVGINAERFDGFLGRLWSLPIHRGAAMIARLVAEVVRLLVTTLIILGVGMLLGFRFHRGVAEAVLWVAIPVIFGVAFAAIATTVALYWPKSVMVEALQPVIILGANFCTGFIPVDLYPDWVQPAVRNQPMSQAVEAMRGLSVGGPVTSPLTSTLLWCGAIFVVCLLPIMMGYRRASTSR